MHVPIYLFVCFVLVSSFDMALLGIFFSILIRIFFLLEYGCFTMLCKFLLYSKMNQLYIYIYPLFFGFPSHLSHHSALSRVLCAI